MSHSKTFLAYLHEGLLKLQLNMMCCKTIIYHSLIDCMISGDLTVYVANRFPTEMENNIGEQVV
jgi:hypothetical protein